MARKQIGAASTANSTDAATTADVALAASAYLGGNAQTGTTYTYVLADAGKFLTFSNAGAITVTVPTNASVAFPLYSRIDCAVIGAGAVTVVGAGGVTVNVTPSAVSRAQFSAFSLVKYATDTWLLTGDLT